jgi:hypothetical protein
LPQACPHFIDREFALSAQRAPATRHP